jgi:hypothetical protein
MLLELIAGFDPFLAKHIERYANQGFRTTSYLPKTICDEFINLMAEKVLKCIGNEIKKIKVLFFNCRLYTRYSTRGSTYTCDLICLRYWGAM